MSLSETSGGQCIFSGGSAVDHVASAFGVKGVGLDLCSGAVYWTEISGEVRRANLDGTIVETIDTDQLEPGEAIQRVLTSGYFAGTSAASPSMPEIAARISMLDHSAGDTDSTIVDRYVFDLSTGSLAVKSEEGHCSIEQAFNTRLDPEHTWVDRMRKEPAAKIACGGAILRSLASGTFQDVFIEGGSTTALAVLGALTVADQLRAARFDRSPLALSTNMPKIYDLILNRRWISPSLLYAQGGSFNPKYGENFPVAETVLRDAMVKTKGLSDDEILRCEEAVVHAWRTMLADGWSFQHTIMTASKFNFGIGPFVGSRHNALLKAAYLATARELTVLIDGSKMLTANDLQREWLNGECSQIIAGQLRSKGYPKRLFAIAGCAVDEQNLDKLAEIAWAVADREPVTRLSLKGDYLRNETRGGAKVDVPQSWAHAVAQILLRKEGTVRVFVSQPVSETEEVFETRLLSAIEEGNRILRGANEIYDKVRVGKPHRTVRRVDLGPYVVPGSDRVNDIAVWECPMELAENGSTSKQIGTVSRAERLA
jgi:hypothetical protein